MANRDVGISVCGVVVGVMLGAGSVLYTQDASLGATTSSEDIAAYWNLDADDARDVNARNIEKKTRLQNSERKLQLKDAPVYEQAGPASEQKAATPLEVDCGLARALLDRVDSAIRSSIPAEEGAGGNDKIQRDALLGVTARLRSEQCSAPAASSEEVEESVKPAAPARKKTVDNDCEQYAEGSVRRAKCDANERKGKNYIGY